jgi:hypothetical protein
MGRDFEGRHYHTSKAAERSTCKRKTKWIKSRHRVLQDVAQLVAQSVPMRPDKAH